MSYNKTTWNKGDVITAEKLNNIESGIENVSSNEGGRTIDLTTLERLTIDGMGAYFIYRYDTGLTANDFVGAKVKYSYNMSGTDIVRSSIVVDAYPVLNTSTIYATLSNNDGFTYVVEGDQGVPAGSIVISSWGD